MKNHLDRRDFLVKGLGALGSVALVGGCQNGPPTGRISPRTPWPPLGPLPRPSTASAYIPAPKPRTPVQLPTPSVAQGPAGSVVNPIPRSSWARYGPSPLEINPMRGINRITIHHEGTPAAVYFSDPTTTAQRLESIRRGHRGRGWSDIGYHFVVDRAGRVWEGRPLKYQGAHVKDKNEHNIGIMVLGNFNKQHPTDVQLTTMRSTVQYLRRRYHVSQGAIFTHQELNATSCPGRQLQPRVSMMRGAGQFA